MEECFIDIRVNLPKMVSNMKEDISRELEVGLICSLSMLDRIYVI